MLTNEKKDRIQAEALAAIGDSKQAGINVSMGVGKCLIGLKHMKARYHETAKFLVVIPKNTVKDSWVTDAFNFELEYLVPHITFVNYRSISKMDFDYDVVYLDECHSMKFSHGDWLSIYQIKYEGTTIGMTGTYPKWMRDEKGQMCKRFCPKVFEYITDDAVEDGILNDYRIFVHKLKLGTTMTLEKTNKKTKKTWKTSEFKDYLYWCGRIDTAVTGQQRQTATIMRMKALQSYKTKEHYALKLMKTLTDKTLLFANTQAQANRLAPISFHSGNPKSDRNLTLFKTGEVNHLSAVEMLSEGVTIPDLKCIVIMHSYGNNRKAAQKIGRVLRLNPDDIATVHILCYENSQDKKWVTDALAGFDQSKITWRDPL